MKKSEPTYTYETNYGPTLRQHYALSILLEKLRNFHEGLRNKEYSCPENWQEEIIKDSFHMADRMIAFEEREGHENIH